MFGPAAGCLRVVMAHTDSMPAGPGAEDNASGLGVLAGLAPRLGAIDPRCAVWLVATGAEERLYTGSPDHLGALALARMRPARSGCATALSLDEVGVDDALPPALAGRRAAPRGRARAAARGPGGGGADGLAARRRARGTPTIASSSWPGCAAVKLGMLDNPCRHQACDVLIAAAPRRVPARAGRRRGRPQTLSFSRAAAQSICSHDPGQRAQRRRRGRRGRTRRSRR